MLSGGPFLFIFVSSLNSERKEYVVYNAHSLANKIMHPNRYVGLLQNSACSSVSARYVKVSGVV